MSSLLAEVLHDASSPIAKRMRAVFLLRQINTREAVQALEGALGASSVLLAHECAYALGQLCWRESLDALARCAGDPSYDPIVRHECVEALSNIGGEEAERVVEGLCDDECDEVRDTAEIALENIRRASGEMREVMMRGDGPMSKYASIDPAPPLSSFSVTQLQQILCNRSLSLYERYRAMFTLRNIGDRDAIAALTAGLDGEKSPVFRHEVAYVLGQIGAQEALECLTQLLADKNEHAMVRHEAAEAIGAIAEEDSEPMLRSYIENNDNPIVQESCHVALDLVEYWNNSEWSSAMTEEQSDCHKESCGDSSKQRVHTDDIPVKTFTKRVLTKT